MEQFEDRPQGDDNIQKESNLHCLSMVPRKSLIIRKSMRGLWESMELSTETVGDLVADALAAISEGIDEDWMITLKSKDHSGTWSFRLLPRRRGWLLWAEGT